jgi:hypothetical protein
MHLYEAVCGVMYVLGVLGMCGFLCDLAEDVKDL